MNLTSQDSWLWLVTFEHRKICPDTGSQELPPVVPPLKRLALQIPSVSAGSHCLVRRWEMRNGKEGLLLCSTASGLWWSKAKGWQVQQRRREISSGSDYGPDLLLPSPKSAHRCQGTWNQLQLRDLSNLPIIKSCNQTFSHIRIHMFFLSGHQKVESATPPLLSSPRTKTMRESEYFHFFFS